MARQRRLGLMERSGAIRLWSGARPPPTISGWREALTRGPNPGRRDRAEPLARPTRREASQEELAWADATWVAGC